MLCFMVTILSHVLFFVELYKFLITIILTDCTNFEITILVNFTFKYQILLVLLLLKYNNTF